MKIPLILSILFTLFSTRLIADRAQLNLKVYGSLLGTADYYCPSEEDAEEYINGELVLNEDVAINGKSVTLRARPTDILFKSPMRARDGSTHRPMAQATYRGGFPLHTLKFGENKVKVPTFSDFEIEEGENLLRLVKVTRQEKTLGQCLAEIHGPLQYYGTRKSHSCSFNLSLEELAPDLLLLLKNRRQSIQSLVDSYPELLGELNVKLENFDQVMSKLESKDFEYLTPDDLAGYESAINYLVSTLEDISGLRTKITEQEDKIADGLEELEGKLSDELAEAGIDDSFEEDLGRFDEFDIEIPDFEEEFDTENSVYKQLSDATIAELQALIADNDRLGFLSRINIWKIQNENLDNLSLLRSSVAIIERETYLVESERVLGFINQYLDDGGFFKDSGASEEVKQSINGPIAQANPELSRRLKKAVNKTSALAGTRKNEVLESIPELSAALSEVDISFSIQGLLHGAAAVLERLPSLVFGPGECLVKTTVAGPYADYYELRYHKSFCDGSDLASWEVTLAGTSLGVTLASTALSTPIGGSFASFASKIFKTFLGVGVKVWKSAKVIASSKVVDRIFDSARKWDSVQSLLHVVKGNYQVAADGTRKIVTGMHSKLGFDNFLKLNQKAGKIFNSRNVTSFTTEKIEAGGDILSQTLPNGVKRLQFPRDAFGSKYNKAIAYTESGQRLKGAKTLWPESFDISRIAEASNSAVRANPNIRDGLIDGVMDGVKFKVRVDSAGKIVTTYPNWIQ